MEDSGDGVETFMASFSEAWHALRDPLLNVKQKKPGRDGCHLEI